MSIHRSLAVSGKLVRQRNVFTRAERLEVLKKAGRYKEGESVFGLPKVITSVKVKKAKKKEAEGVAAPGAAATPAAKPEAAKKDDKKKK